MQALYCLRPIVLVLSDLLPLARREAVPCLAQNGSKI